MIILVIFYMTDNKKTRLSTCSLPSEVATRNTSVLITCHMDKFACIKMRAN